MIIRTNSTRLAFAACLCRFLPPVVAGRLTSALYPIEVARRENAHFVRKSNLADVTLGYPKADYIAFHFAVRGHYEWPNIVVANTLCKPGDTILDIGANMGTETLLFAKRVGPTGRIVAFEPLPENYQLLREHIARNGLTNTQLFDEAVSDRPGTLRFLPPQEAISSGEGRLLEQGVTAPNALEVRVRALDQMFEEGLFPCPRLIVMDTEGAELFVLRGAAKVMDTCAPAIILENQPRLLAAHGHAPSQVQAFLREHGYAAYSFSRHGVRPVGSATETTPANWLCLRSESDGSDQRFIRTLARRLRWAAWLPPIRGLNPAVVS